MKKFLLLILLASPAFAMAQATVEKSIFTIQTGTLGIWLSNESRLSNSIALRTEAGLDAGVFMGGIYDNVGFLLTPVITLEPRWYYNLSKREAKSKNISGNSGNFLSVKTSYNPDWFIISADDNIMVIDQISVIPTWGIRRMAGKHFNYEAGFGIGYRHIFVGNTGYTGDQDEAAVNLHLRIGYKF